MWHEMDHSWSQVSFINCLIQSQGGGRGVGGVRLKLGGECLPLAIPGYLYFVLRILKGSPPSCASCFEGMATKSFQKTMHLGRT